MKKENKYIYLSAFIILIIFSLFSIFNAFKKYSFKYNVLGYNNAYEQIKVNIVLNKKINDKVLICYNDYCKSLNSDVFSNVYFGEFSPIYEEFFDINVNRISFLYPEKYSNIINNASIFVGNKKYYLNKDDISKLKTKTVSFLLDGNKEAIQLKSNELIKINNYKGIFAHFKILLLSLFYMPLVFAISFFWLYVAYLIYDKKLKNNFKINFNFYPILLFIVFAFAIFLRLNQLNYFPLWLDEIYVKTVAIKSFLSCFQDAGNPPLFYILEFFASKISANDCFLRIIPVFFGILFPYLTYILFKKFGKNIALFAAFFASFNLINIYHSSDIRSYTMCMDLCVILIYYLFEYINNPNKKNLIIYSIFAICAINTHYYFSFLIFTNCLWIIASLIDNNQKQNIKAFSISTLITYLSFIPYLLISFKTALNSTFNSWIMPLSKNTFLFIINQYFINKYVFIFLAILIISLIIPYYFNKTLKEKLPQAFRQKQEFLVYLIYSILFVMILICLVSIFVKPILHKRILLSIYPLLFLGEIIILSMLYDLKLRLLPLLLMFVFFSMTKPMLTKDIYRFDDFMYFVQNDINQYGKDYQIHCITNDRKDYLNAYKDINENKRIVWHFVDTNAKQHLEKIEKSDYIPNSSKGVVYFHDMSADIDNVSLLKPNAYIYHTNTIRIGKIVFKEKN